MKKTSTLILFFAIGLCLSAQNLYVHPIGGEHVVFSLADKPKITFGEGTKTIDQITFQLSDIQKLSFRLNPDANIATSFYDKIHLYPNPVENELYLNIQGLTQGLSYRIFNMNGKLQTTGKIHSETTTINMQNFRTGVYVLHINQNGQQIQSFKIVKQ
ncbi:MAG: T9SS type A sorting domain-containing protein [Bacteroidales bacterium]|nr:T9SS type A sorting domain-containing protein [Bacteroidales bacterium]